MILWLLVVGIFLVGFALTLIAVRMRSPRDDAADRFRVILGPMLDDLMEGLEGYADARIQELTAQLAQRVIELADECSSRERRVKDVEERVRSFRVLLTPLGREL